MRAPAGMIWDARVRRWVPDGMVWDRRTHRWVPQPTPALPASEAGEASEGVVRPASAEVPEPRRGPRSCPQRSRRKRWGAGPRAHQPTRNGQPIARGGGRSPKRPNSHP